MKNIFKNNIVNRLRTIPLLMTCVVLFFGSCEDRDLDDNGHKTDPPKISNVRLLDPESAETSLDLKNGAPLDSWVTIQGDNLGATQKVYFNNEDAYINPVFVTEENIVITVPGTTPTLATHNDSLVINQIKVVTEYGEATYEVLILPPPPVIDSMSNEFAKAGEQLTLWGKYFFFVESVSFPGDVAASNYTSSTNGRSMVITVPEGVVEGGEMVVVSQSGISTPGVSPTFNDTLGIFINGSDPTIQVNPDGMKFVNELTNPDIPNLMGDYIWNIHFEIVPASYWVVQTALETNGMQGKLSYPDYDTLTSVNKLMLEFEMYVYDPWLSGLYEIAFLPDGEWTDAYRFGWEGWSGLDNGLTNGWKTCRVPLKSFFTDAASTIPNNGISTYGDIKGQSFNMNLKNTAGDIGGVTIPVFNIAFDNFRIVLVK